MTLALHLLTGFSLVVLILLVQVATAENSSGSCRPNLFPTLKIPGFCVKIGELRTRCFDLEASRSTTDCPHVKGNFCCYSSVAQGNTILGVQQFDSEPKLEILQTEAKPQALIRPQPPQASNLEKIPEPSFPVETSTQRPRIKTNPIVDQNPRCSSVNDCPDAGMTCFHGQCQCWSVQGFSAVQTWSCSDDVKCRTLFPGHQAYLELLACSEFTCGYKVSASAVNCISIRDNSGTTNSNSRSNSNYGSTFGSRLTCRSCCCSAELAIMKDAFGVFCAFFGRAHENKGWNIAVFFANPFDCLQGVVFGSLEEDSQPAERGYYGGNQQSGYGGGGGGGIFSQYNWAGSDLPALMDELGFDNNQNQYGSNSNQYYGSQPAPSYGGNQNQYGPNVNQNYAPQQAPYYGGSNNNNNQNQYGTNMYQKYAPQPAQMYKGGNYQNNNNYNNGNQNYGSQPAPSYGGNQNQYGMNMNQQKYAPQPSPTYGGDNNQYNNQNYGPQPAQNYSSYMNQQKYAPQPSPTYGGDNNHVKYGSTSNNNAYGDSMYAYVVPPAPITTDCGIVGAGRNTDFFDTTMILREAGMLNKPVQLRQKGGQVVPTIIGGTDAKVNQICWQVRVENTGLDDMGQAIISTCGGSIIGSRTILTAAHCVFENGKIKESNVFEVRIGAMDNAQLGGPLKSECEKIFQVAKVTPHKDFTPVKKDEAFRSDNDVALLTLTEDIDFAKSKCACRLCLQNTVPDVDAKCIASGFGIQTEIPPPGTNFIPANLRWAQLDVKKPESKECKTATVTDTLTVCAGGLIKGTSTCQGDSGGPLACLDESSGKFYSGGITSFGTTGCPKEDPAHFTRTQAFLRWIRMNADPTDTLSFV
ncbi:hypothetical protein BV898_16580 [Hypsibius exemplaris]|uniref:Peptidase S1 domain-containing protein n=1 Tax=Hypsibius exemplaris TaxID=2072580 RepID=A0A9X6NG50_HYPEX|nr:hypothetical protein BV898_16580 [Hypsibius exemplaris]